MICFIDGKYEEFIINPITLQLLMIDTDYYQSCDVICVRRLLAQVFHAYCRGKKMLEYLVSEYKSNLDVL